MGGGGSKPANPIDAIKNAVKKAEDDLKKVFVDGIKNKIVTPIEDIIDDIVDEFESMIEKIENIPTFIEDIFDGIMRDIERIAQDKLDELKKPFKGIDYMIQDFQRMLCWVKTLPVRIDLILNGIDNIFVGIGEQLEIYIQAFEMGVEETGTLANYSGALVKSYIACIEKFIVNLYKCFLYYMVDLFFKLLYLPVILILWIASLFGVNGYPMEESFWKTMKTLDAFVYNNAKFHILEFPESIKDDCYRCTRLRKEVVEYQANHLDRVFNEDIPKKLKSSKGVKTMKRGQKQFDEVNEFNPRQPKRVV
tara:strand:- start:5681 stop:6601 length:921 start_codon:yes stop_codon:yes gene_type:complete